MGNLFGGLARPGNNRGATAEAIPVVRDKATESEKEAERYKRIHSMFINFMPPLVKTRRQHSFVDFRCLIRMRTT